MDLMLIHVDSNGFYIDFIDFNEIVYDFLPFHLDSLAFHALPSA